mgnify:CR=1 FL=1
MPRANQNHHIEVLDREVKVVKQVRALSSDVIKPRYRVARIITSEEPKTVKVRYTCGDEVNEKEITLSKTMRYMVELIRG